ncbi:hypothetical protein Gpo141_00011204 [Globisporangium polare]
MLAKLSFAAVAALACFASNAAAISNCTSDEVAVIAKLDAVLANAPECERLNSLVAGEVTLLQVCSDTDCIKIVKKAASQAPSCLVNGETAERISLVAYSSCSVSDSSSSNSSSSTVSSPSPSPSPTTKAPSSSGSVAGEAASPAVVSTPAPTTAAPKSAGVHVSVASSVAVSSAAVLLFAAWM